MAASGRSRKQRACILSGRHEAEGEQEVTESLSFQSVDPVTSSSSKARPPVFLDSTTNGGPSNQISEPMGTFSFQPSHIVYLSPCKNRADPQTTRDSGLDLVLLKLLSNLMQKACKSLRK